MFAYCCGGTVVAREIRGKMRKLTRLDHVIRPETRGCYPGIPWAYPGDVFFRPLFMIRMCNHASLFISGVVVTGMVPNVIPDRYPWYVVYISVRIRQNRGW